MKWKHNSTVILIVYADDIVLIGNDSIVTNKLKGYTRKCFDIKDERALKYFYGIKDERALKYFFGKEIGGPKLADQNRDLSQWKYVSICSKMKENRDVNLLILHLNPNC